MSETDGQELEFRSYKLVARLLGTGSKIWRSTSPPIPRYPQVTSEIVMDNQKKLVAIDAVDLIALELPPKKTILSPWLESQSLSMIYAPRGIGKTHVSLGIGYAVASGGNFLRWSAAEAREVLFVDGEMAASDLKDRLGLLHADKGTTRTAKPLKIITPDLQHYGTPDISTIEGQTQIDAHISPTTELIILDNLATLAKSGIENEAESWQPIQDWLLRLRASGKSVLFIHHAGKNGNQRGTSAREDVLDTVIQLQRPSGYRPEDGASFDVIFNKSRSLAGNDIARFSASLKTNAEGQAEWQISGGVVERDQKMLDLKNDGLNQSEIAAELNIDKSTVSRRIRELDLTEASTPPIMY